MKIKATELNQATTDELKEIKTGLENQLNKVNVRPWEKTIIKMHLEDINKELERRS